MTAARGKHCRSRAPAALLLAAAYAALAFAFWHWRILAGAPHAGPVDFRTSDLYTQYIPVLSRAFAELGSGHLPLWNADQLAGVPTLPSWFTLGVFYPLNALAWSMPIGRALGWTTCLHIAVAGAAMHWLARTLGLAPAAARFAAVVFMLSRPFLFEPNLFHAMALAPAVLAAWIRVVSSPRAAAAVAATALQIGTGGLQMVTYTFYALALLLPFAVRRCGAATPWLPTLAWMGVAASLGVGLTAFALLPTWSLASLTERRPGGSPCRSRCLCRRRPWRSWLLN